MDDLIDTTKERFLWQKAYVEGCARMVQAEAMQSSRAGRDAKDVLENADRLLGAAGAFQRMASEAGVGRAAATSSAASSVSAQTLGSSPGRDVHGASRQPTAKSESDESMDGDQPGEAASGCGHRRCPGGG